MKKVKQVFDPKLAIVGMDYFLGSCNGLDAFERSIYDGTSSEAAQLSSQEVIIRQIVDNALQDAGLNQGRVAVIITQETEYSIQHPVQTKLPGPSFTLSNTDYAFKALEVSQILLAAREVDAVLIVAVTHAGGVTVVLKLETTALQNSDRIYAVIDVISLVPNSSTSELDSRPPVPDSETVRQACQQAFNLAGVKPAAIGYLEVLSSGIQQSDLSEIKGLVQAYQIAPELLSCAISSVKANTSHTHAVSEIASLIKTALCLYYRYIPAPPQWSSPESLGFLTSEVWQGSPFYVTDESRPWFLEQGATRIAAINSVGLNGTCAHLILSESPSQKERSSRYLEQMPFYLFPLTADYRSALLEQLRALQHTIEDCSSLSAAASQSYAAFQQRSGATYALAILGHNKDELLREIQRAFKGVAVAFETGQDWQTPVGNYFTANPLGKGGNIAFVYPGAYSSYIGLARNLFRLFPQIYDDPAIKSVYSRVAKIEKLLYPRSLSPLSKRQLEALEQQLLDNPLAMLESETGFAGLFSAILRDYFQVQPQCAFGYSLGETSMMFSQGVWTSFSQGSDALNSSSLFSTRLSGPKNAVCEYWELPKRQSEQADIWSTYVLMAPVTQVKECLEHENHVYLTQINTPKEVVVAGEPQACLSLIKSLDCDAFRAPFNHVIHCEPMRSEYHEIARLNTLSIQNVPKTVFYSAAEYDPIRIDSHSIGHSIAKGLCQQLDFPRLINRVYGDGIRIFIEAGVGSNCSRWISETLKEKEHATIFLNRRGVDDHTSIVRALVKLLSHRVSLDLSPLYCQIQKRSDTPESIPRELEKNVSPNLLSPQYQQLSENTTRVTKAHAAFLDARQESLQQISNIIQLQIGLSKRLYDNS